MILRPDRILLSESELFSIINSKRKVDLSFLQNDIELSQLSSVIEDIKLRRFPALRQILNALSSKQITLCYTQNTSSGLVYAPVMDSGNKKIIGVKINLSKFAKKKVVVDSLTGDTKEVLDLNYEVLYNLLLGAICILNSDRCYFNSNLVKYLRTIWIDIVQQILNRSFGNPIYGDKFRFVLGFFFHNGEVSAKDLAIATKFEPDKAAVLEASYPEFFGKKDGLKITELLELIQEEFPNMKNIEVNSFIAAAVTMLGDSAFYLIDNQAYYLGVVAIKCRKDKDIFTGHLLRNIEVDKGAISSLILQSL
ncbi:MAG: hypothetical protein ACRCX2_14700 [Paraclostridium sp.]